jgi:uncharacterized membrane protein YbhN (UPF0104 family)
MVGCSALVRTALDRRKLLTVAGGAITVACLAALAYLVYREREVLVVHVLTADRRQLAAVGVWYVAALAVSLIAWASIMGRLGGRAGFWRHAGIFCLANMAKRLPGTLWYVGGRTVLYSRAGVPARTVILASAIEGTLTWLAGVAIAVPFLAVALPQSRWLWIGGGAALLLLLLNPIAVRWLLDRAAKRVAKGGELRGVELRHVYAWLGLYVAGWVSGGAVLASVVSLFQEVPASQLPWIIGSWTVAGSASMLAVLLPSNLGITEVTMTALLGQVIPAGLAVLVAVSARVLITLLDILGGALALLIQRVGKA